MTLIKNIISPEEEAKMNQENNQIAMKMLMPEKAFKEFWAKTEDPKEIAKKFDVSEGAAALWGKQLSNEMFM
ncbi:MAG: ImmA/IrrE family metallo-endopeptidase [Candidatus Pacebacteria bacterium]|nr:ImmA/IrrE family metallo-endopeptidase [Candidatus Paceibacterota bacterium]